MDEDALRWWREIERGEREVSWELMARPIDRSYCLTESGRRVAHWAVEQLGRFFGSAWLRRSLRDGSPMMSWRWWPASDTPDTYLRLIALGARLALLEGAPGWRDLRRSAQTQTGYWPHGLLQLEVGGLALRHGWAVELEPSLASGRYADLRVRRGEAAFLVEALSLRLADDVRRVSAFSDRVFERLLMIGQRHRVTVSGEVGAVVAEAVSEAWLTRAEEAAARIAGTGGRMSLPTPGGGEVVLVDDDPRQGETATLSGPLITGDEWSRVARMIVDKAEQAKSDEPLWLRMDETHFLWDLTIPATWPRQQMHEALAGNIAARVETFGHVAGVVLSRPPQMATGAEAGWELLDGRAGGLIRQVRKGFFREAVFVAGPHPAGVHQLAEWREWYLAEETWLDWALERLGLPAVAGLLHERPAT